MMGKRKRSSGRQPQNPDDGSTPSSSDNMPNSSRTDQLSRERSSRLSELKTLSPGVDVLNSNVKLSNAQSSHAHPHYNLGHTTFLKRSRYSYGHRYSRRNSGSHTNTSTSPGKTASSSDGIVSFKLTGQSGSDSGCQIGNIFVICGVKHEGLRLT
uniref:Uncharacterized protein LOC105641262 isoform X1 n=1 Tax=Rhizophora mucronata TaxID=61149 RepID=A0A2P2IZD4_RHIMU